MVPKLWDSIDTVWNKKKNPIKFDLRIWPGKFSTFLLSHYIKQMVVKRWPNILKICNESNKRYQMTSLCSFLTQLKELDICLKGQSHKTYVVM